jgi:glucokinase
MEQISMVERFVIGVDIGGTKVAAGLVNERGKILFQSRTPMVADRDGAAGLSAVVAAIEEIFAKSDEGGKRKPGIRGIGICSPGPLDPKRGVVLNPPNVPCWRNFPLADEVAKAYGVPVKVDNDANAAALAESRWGAGQGYRNIFYATIGTGIGTGIIFDHQIYHGRTGAAGEGGHLSIDHRGPRCGCGKPGCIEALAAGPAIAKRARAKLRASDGHDSQILDLTGGDIEAVSSETVGRAYSQGDALAKQILDETVEFLALWLGNIIDLLDPEVLIVGGGVASMLSPVFEEWKNRIPRYCVNPRCQEVPLLKAHYGADSGIAGGGALCASL